MSCFAPKLIATNDEKALKFEDGLKPYLKNKISILKLGIYLEDVDKALIVENDNESFISIGNNKGRGIGVMVLMVTKHRSGLFLLEIIIKGRQHKIRM